MIAHNARLLLLSGTAAMAMAAPVQAQSAAASTTAGTTISNTATVTYTVNGSAQTTNSTTASFVVDRKVNLTVVNDQAGASTKVNLGQTAAVTRFRVTNNTNGTQDFLLTAIQAGIVGGLVGTVTGVDDFTMTNLKVFADRNGNGVYDPAVDTASYIDELLPDASVAVFIVGDVPTTGNPNLHNVALQAAIAAGGGTGQQGAALAETVNLNNADMTTDVVFADNDNDGLGFDIARNGQGWAYATYEIGARNVALTVSKSALVLSDGVNLANPRSLPGAVVQYCLLASNATLTASANDVTLSDIIPTNTTYVPGSVQVGLPGGTCTLAGAVQDDATVFDAASRTVTVNVGTLVGGTSSAVSFRVTIN